MYQISVISTEKYVCDSDIIECHSPTGTLGSDGSSSKSGRFKFRISRVGPSRTPLRTVKTEREREKKKHAINNASPLQRAMTERKASKSEHSSLASFSRRLSARPSAFSCVYAFIALRLIRTPLPPSPFLFPNAVTVPNSAQTGPSIVGWKIPERAFPPRDESAERCLNRIWMVPVAPWSLLSKCCL